MPLGAARFALGGGEIPFEATGGTTTTYSIYKSHTYTSSSNFVINSIPVSGKTVDVLLVAGGGGGGSGAAYFGG